jgi:ketol-acid reductoisomerase
MVNVVTDNMVTMDAVDGKSIAVIGYGAQGRAQSLCMKDSGLKVMVGLRKGGPSWKQAVEDGMEVMTMAQAAQQGDIIHLLIPDEHQKEVYDAHIKDHVKPGNVLSFSHGFNVVYDQIMPPQGVDVIMIAPKSPGTEERLQYLEGFGVPALVAVHTDVSGSARDTALAMAKACGFTRAGVIECTFEDETYEDIFGEQCVLCGGIVELIKTGFEVLLDAGYPPEMAYFECLHEMKLIVDLIQKGGLGLMWDVVSNTAEYGGRTRGEKIITSDTREAMKEILKKVENGTFAREWIAENKNGLVNLKKMREEETNHPIEVVGREIRALFRNPASEK